MLGMQLTREFLHIQLICDAEMALPVSRVRSSLPLLSIISTRSTVIGKEVPSSHLRFIHTGLIDISLYRRAGCLAC